MAVRSRREIWLSNKRGGIVNKWILIVCLILSGSLAGCQTVQEAGQATGRAVGTVTNTVGSVTEGGAETVQGEVAPEENPYGR